MYCRQCGHEVKEKAVVCSACGEPIDDFTGTAAGPAATLGVPGNPWNWPMIIGLFVLTLFVPPAGIVFGVIGLMDPAKKAQGAMLATLGVCLTLLLAAALWGF
jgi:hypothetical protein